MVVLGTGFHALLCMARKCTIVSQGYRTVNIKIYVQGEIEGYMCKIDCLERAIADMDFLVCLLLSSS